MQSPLPDRAASSEPRELVLFDGRLRVRIGTGGDIQSTAVAPGWRAPPGRFPVPGAGEPVGPPVRHAMPGVTLRLWYDAQGRLAAVETL